MEPCTTRKWAKRMDGGTRSNEIRHAPSPRRSLKAHTTCKRKSGRRKPSYPDTGRRTWAGSRTEKDHVQPLGPAQVEGVYLPHFGRVFSLAHNCVLRISASTPNFSELHADTFRAGEDSLYHKRKVFRLFLTFSFAIMLFYKDAGRKKQVP